MTRNVLVIVSLAAVLSSSAVSAHHSYADFLDTTRSITGTLEAIEFASPHTVLTVRLEDGTAYKAVWNAVRQLELQGVERTALKVGDTVFVTGFPHKDPTTREFAKLREVRRMADRWAWRMNDYGQVSIVAAR
jgi:hypothetical protein